jgi:hypothetical protein
MLFILPDYGCARCQTEVTRHTMTLQPNALAQNLTTEDAHSFMTQYPLNIAKRIMQAATVNRIYAASVTNLSGLNVCEMVTKTAPGRRARA